MAETAKKYAPIPAATEAAATVALDAAFAAHRALGPGLLESVYEACLCHELAKLKVPFARQVALPVMYDGIRLDAGLRMDVLVGNCVVLELKAVEAHNRLYEAQLITYLKLSGLRLGLLINFNVPVLKDGIHRIVR